MQIGYYPGCTLKTKARNLEIAAIKAMETLGVELVELDRWNCCGAVYSLADDDLVHLLAPVRDLIRARDQGHTRVLALCSMCYNTLARANKLMREDEEKRDALNQFMEEETDYAGEVEVVHMLNFLRDEIGWDKVKEAVKKPLNMKVAPYYGCTLTRPYDVSIDPAIDPPVFKDLITALGGEVVEYPDSEVCCGSYQIISNADAAGKTTAVILGSAEKRGAEALALSCPLCEYNLGRKQDLAIQAKEDLKPLPVYYFTQLMAVAFGLPDDVSHLELNMPGAADLLREKGLLAS